MKKVKGSFIILLCLAVFISIIPVAEADQPQTKTVSITVTLNGVHTADDFSETYSYDDGQYSGTLTRQDNTLKSIVRSTPAVTYTYQSDTKYPNDKSASSQYSFPSTYSASYYDALSGQYFSATLFKSGSPYFSGSVTSKTIYWTHYGYQYDPINHTKLGYMSNNSTTYYSGQYRFSDSPRQPSDYYGPSGEAGLGWVQYKAPAWDGALQDATKEPWRSICLAYHGTTRFISESGRTNRYRKPVRIYYRRTASCQYIYQQYTGTATVTDTKITYTGIVTLDESGPDIEIIDTTITDWYEGMDVTVSATVRNNSTQPIPSVAILLAIGSDSYTGTIPLPPNGSNLAVFRITVPEAGSYTIQIIADSDGILDEIDENNNILTRNIQVKEIPNSIVLDPDDSEMEQYYESYGLTSIPSTSSSDYHTWQEVRLESGNYVTKTFWARLNTVFEILPDDRIAIPDEPNTLESGYGVQVSCTTTLTTNYDHPEKLVGVQMVWVRYPESAYGQTLEWVNINDSLQCKTGNTGDTIVTWQLAVNPYSVTNSRLHYTPLWFPDEDYTALTQAFHSWSPVGQLYGFETDSVTILRDMYDRISTVKR